MLFIGVIFLQDRLDDVDGDRPFFVHEVIDQGGEAISMSEYFNAGKVS